MAKKKEETPVKPAPATALIFQAPDLPTPKVDTRSGKLAVEVEKPKPEPKVVKERKPSRAKPEAEKEEPTSTRVEAKKSRRRDSRDSSRRRSSVTLSLIHI